MKSLQGRLTAGLVASLITIFLLQWALVSLSVQHVTENYVASRLGHEIENLLAALSFGPDGEPMLEADRTGAIYQQPFSGHYFRIAIGGSTLRSRSLWDTDLAVPELPPGQSSTLAMTGPERQPLLVLVEGYRKQDRSLTIAAAEDLSAIKQDIARFQTGYAALSLLVLALLIIVQRSTVRSALKPINQARENLVKLEQGTAEKMNENVPVEISPLVHEINRLVELTVERLSRSRRAVGNLAHALKTPLTVLNQIAGDPALLAQPDLRKPMLEQTGAIASLIDRELRRARLAGEGPSAVRFSAALELSALIDALQRMYRDKNLQIDHSEPPDHVFSADREDMLELFGNLLDNACKWANGRVRIRIEESPGLVFTVEDDGPGAPAGDLGALTTRGVRLDESTQGHGLGLSIVRDIVEQYGGTLDLGRSELGGLLVSVHLPSGLNK